MAKRGSAREFGETSDERREHLAADIDVFLANGGRIQQFPMGASGYEVKRDQNGRIQLTLGKAVPK